MRRVLCFMCLLLFLLLLVSYSSLCTTCKFVMPADLQTGKRYSDLIPN